MNKVYDIIEDNEIYNQIINLIKKFIKEQIGSSRELQKKYTMIEKYYLNLLKNIRYNQSKYIKLYYIKWEDKVVGIEIAQFKYDRKIRRVVGYKPCIFIENDYRGKKINGNFIASILDKEVEKFFIKNEVTHDRIVTLQKNKRQINVYKRLGYKIIRESKGSVYLERLINKDKIN